MHDIATQLRSRRSLGITGSEKNRRCANSILKSPNNQSSPSAL